MQSHETYSFIHSDDPRLNKVIELWDSFANSISGEEKIGIVYHGDMDGLVGATYIRRALLKYVPESMTHAYWVSTDEYDFELLRQWVSEQDLNKFVSTDVSIENHQPTLQFISRHVSDKAFIYDHHFVNGVVDDPKVTLANPTPEKLDKGMIPVPTFLFAYRVARENNLHFPDWLLLLSIFAEGVDSFFEGEARLLYERVFDKKASDSIKEDFKRTPLSKISNLVRAGFSLPQKNNTALQLLDRVATGDLLSFDDLRDQLAYEFEPTSSDIASRITHYLNVWKRKLGSAEFRDEPVVFIPINAPHSVAGPVASILRGQYPDKVLITYIHRDDKVVFELRTRNDTHLNLAKILGRVASEVEVTNYGGHPMAAGAIIRWADLRKFTETLEREILADFQKAEGDE